MKSNLMRGASFVVLLGLALPASPAQPGTIPLLGAGSRATALPPAVTSIGSNSNITGATLTQSTGVIPAGASIVVCVQEFGSSSANNMSDSVNGAYTLVNSQSDVTGPSVTAVFAFLNSAAISSGTITYTKNQGNAHVVLWGAYAINLTGSVDAAVTTGSSSAAGAPPVVNVTSGTPASANELFVACTGGQTSPTQGYTQDTSHGWIAPPFSLINSGVTNADSWLAGGYLVNSGTGTKTFNPTITNGGGSRVADTVIIGIK